MNTTKANAGKYLGRLEPKDRSHEGKYPAATLLGIISAKVVERTLPVPLNLRTYYDQGQSNACVGFSSSWMMSIYNTVSRQRNNPRWKQKTTEHPQKYDARWLYRTAQDNDLDVRNDPNLDVGTYVWAAMYCLQHFGHKKLEEAESDLRDGILSYYWATTVDQVRTAIAINRPVVFGIPWYEEFNVPVITNKEYWIGTSANWGKVLGGHAICCYAASDERQAFKLVNSWGTVWQPSWLSYKSFSRLLTEGTEACIAVDRATLT